MAAAQVKSGLDILNANNFAELRGKRVAVLCNQAAITSSGEQLLDAALAANINIQLILAPEHGFSGHAQDMISVEDTVDAKTSIPIRSLYGKTPASLAPTVEDLNGIDLLLFDLQDVGARYYTFAQTLGYAMEVCGKAGTKVLVIDRVNPINGVAVEGSPLKRACRSFCGYAPVPARHGLTMGELANLMRSGFGHGQDAIPAINCELEVLKLEGWKRGMFYDDTGLPWVKPSPNMFTLSTAIVYPGTCLIECTNVSEARGTERAFEWIGAPFVKPEELITEIEKLLRGEKGFLLKPISFTPRFQKFTGMKCHGIEIDVTDRAAFRPIRFGLALTYALATLYPEDFKWRGETYEFVDNVPAIDLLYGSDTFRLAVETRAGLNAVFEEMSDFEYEFLQTRREFLLY